MGLRTRLLLAVLVAVVPACAQKGSGRLLAEGERMPGGITVTSTAFAPGRPVPERYSCEGDNLPPPLAWTGVPAGTRELALVVEDPDAPGGVFVHWLVVGVDPATTALTGTDPPPGATVLPGSSDNPTYIGPCPPDGQDHHYHFEVYALPRRPALDASGDPVRNVRAVRATATAGGDLVGTFAR